MTPSRTPPLFDAIKAHLRPDIEVIELDAKINDPVLPSGARACAIAL
ncbi:MAG: hypothetical protein WDN28_04900 [Chthoniobacter sp.]